MLRRLLLTTSLLLVALAFLSLNQPALADGPVQVASNVQWTDTGIALQAGQRFTIRATGKISIQAAEPNKPLKLFTAIGNSRSRCNDAACALPKTATGLLIGRVGDGPVFRIGVSGSFKASSTGALLLGINDISFEDNGGEFAVTVVVRPLPQPSPTPPPQIAVPQVPDGATARCKDGTYSFAVHHQGACSHHDGVAEWYK